MLPALIAASDQPTVAVGALHSAAAVLKALLHGDAEFFQPAAAGIEHARAVGSDYFAALLGFELGETAGREMQYGAAPPFSPSQFVGWVGQAQAAFARCKRLLPSLWLVNVTDKRTPALAALPWLRQLAAAGDRWGQPPPETRAAVDKSLEEQAKLFFDPNYNICCNACGRSALTLKVCSKCRVGCTQHLVCSSAALSVQSFAHRSFSLTLGHNCCLHMQAVSYCSRECQASVGLTDRQLGNVCCRVSLGGLDVQAQGCATSKQPGAAYDLLVLCNCR